MMAKIQREIKEIKDVVMHKTMVEVCKGLSKVCIGFSKDNHDKRKKKWFIKESQKFEGLGKIFKSFDNLENRNYLYKHELL